MNAVVHRSGVRSATLALVVCAAVVATPQPVRAADYFWTGSGATGGNGTWSNVNSWSTIVSGTNRPATGPGALDNVYFGITNATSAATVTLSTDAAARSITQSTQTGNMTIASTSGATDRTLTIGAGGLTVASNLSPAWTIGGTGATNRVNVAVDGSQIWSVTGLGNTTFTVRNVVSRTAGDTTSRTLALDMGSGVQGTLTLGDVRDGGSSGSLSLWQAGMTPLAYGTSASYTGRTTISSGRISLAATSLPTSGTLALRTTTNTRGVSLGTGSVTTPQIVVETGMNSFGFASSGTATLGTITRTGGAVVFSGIGTGSTAYLVSNGNNAAGILGAWAIAGNNQYVTVASGSLAVATPTFVGETGLTSTNGVYAVPGNATITLTGPRFAYVVSSSNAFGSTFQIGNNNLTLSGLNAINGGWSVSRGAGNTGQLIIGSDNELTLTGATTFTISVPIVDGAGGAGKLTYAANGDNSSLTLSGSNSYSGGTEVGYSTVNNSNGLALNNAYALGTGTLTINPAGDARSGLILQNSSGAAIALATNNAQAWNGNFRFSGPSDLNMGTGTVSLGATPNAARTVTVNAATLTIGGRIVNGSHADLPTTGLTVSGSALGRLLLSGSNGYTGPTTVSGGILEFATRQAIYGGDTSKWTAANLTTGSGGVMALDVGATGEFTAADLDTFKALGTGTSGFLPASFLGIDTTTVAGGTFTYSSNIANTNGGANAFGIAKIGPGTLVLSGNNTMTGGVSVRGGSLLLTAANQIGTGPMTLVSGTLSTSSDAFMNGTASPLTFAGGVLQITGTDVASLASARTTTFTAASPVNFDITSAANTFEVSQVLNQTTGSLVKLGAGTLVLTNTNTYTGATVIGSSGGPTGGTLRLSNAGRISTGTTATIFAGTLDTNGLNQTIGGLLTLGGGAASTAAGVTTNTGTLTLGGNVTFDATNNPGGATISGNVSLGNASRTFTVGDSTNASSDLTISAAITSGTLTKAGAGVLLLSGTNSYAGVTTVSAGALVANSTASLPGWNTNGYTVSAGGVLAMGSGFSNVESGTVIAGGTFAANSSVGFDTTGGDRTYNTVIANAGANARGLVKLGSGTLTLSAVNTYTGTTAVNEGTLRIGLANAISGTSPLALSGNGSLDLANATSAAAVTLSGSGSIFGSATLTGSSYTINNTAGTTTVSAILGGTATTVTLTKSNAGTAVLSGLNTYRGATTVSGGVLEFNSIANIGTANASALGAPAAADASITLGSNTASATLRYTGTGHSSNRTISTGSAGGIVDASGSGALNMSSGTISATAGTTVTLTGTSTAANSIGVISGSNVTKTGPGLWQLTGNSSYNGRLTVLDGTVVVASVGSSNSSPFGSNTGTASLPRIGDSAVGASGTAALLAQSGSVSRGLYVNQSNGSQVVVLGGTGAGTTFFDSAIRLGRSVTLQASTGGTVEFGGEWLDLNDGSSPQVAFTVGLAGNAGTVVFGSKAPDSITAVNVRRGTLRLNYGVNGTSAIWYATPVTLGETGFGATLDLNQQRVETEAGPIFPSVTQSLGDLTFAGVGSTVTGTGTLRLFKSGSGAIVNVTGTGHQISAAVALADNSTFTLDSGARLLVSSTISGSSDASLTKTGLGTLTLSAANTYSGATNVNAGTLALGISNALSNSTPVSVAGGILDLGSSSDTVASLTLTSGSVTGSGTLTAATYSLGGGAVSANLGGGTLNVTGNASLTGNAAATVVNLDAGSLTLGSGGRFTASPSPVVTGSSGASLTLGGNESFGSLAGFANIALGGSGNRLTVGSSNSSTTYSGVLSGSGGLTKSGTGVFTLAGDNTYSGSTSIDAGTFVVNGSLGSGALSVAAAATLMGSGTIGGAATIAGIHSPGNSPGIETFSSDLTYSGGSSQVIWELWNNTVSNSPLAYDQIVVNGNLSFSGSTSLSLNFGGLGVGSVNWNDPFWSTDQTWMLFDVAGTTSNVNNFSLLTSSTSWLDSNGLAFASSGRSANSFTVSQQGSDVLLRYTVVVPEPTSLALATIGIAAAAWAARRRK